MENKQTGQIKQIKANGPTTVAVCLVLLAFCLLAFTPKKAVLHDFHTSLTEINFNPKTKSLELTIRVFTDDFERALTEINDGKPVKVTPTNDKIDPLILKYLRKHFAFVSPDKQVVGYDYLGKEVELDATWLYVEVPNAANFKGYAIFNSIMVDLFDDQTNLLNLIYPDKKKSFLFNAKIKTALYPF